MCRTSTACNSSATPARLSRDETRRSSCSLPVSAVPRPAESARTCFYRNRKASIVSSQRSPPYSIRLRDGCTRSLRWHVLRPWGLCRIGRHAWALWRPNFILECLCNQQAFRLIYSDHRHRCARKVCTMTRDFSSCGGIYSCCSGLYRRTYRLRGGWLGLGLGVFLLLLTAALTWHGLDLIG